MTAATVRTVGKPDGPEKWIDEIGYAVGTFTSKREDLEEDPRRKTLACCMFHVPHGMRGPYRVEDLPEAMHKLNYVTNFDGYVMCTQPNKRAREGDPPVCQKRAVNRTGLCDVHGGRLHPLDRLVKRELDVSKMNRWQMLCNGLLDVEDLDDEELMRGMCRRPNGTFPGDTGGAVPRKVYDKMVARLFDRAQEKFRENLLVAVDRLAHIAESDAYEPADQIKASMLIIDRVLGKSVEKVDVTVGAKPFEQILNSIGGRREDSIHARPAIEAEYTVAEEDSEWIDSSESSASESSSTETTVSQQDSPPEAPRTMMRRRSVPRVGQADPREVKLEKAERKATIDEARQKRYAARMQGRTTLDNLAYVRESFPLPEGGHRVQYRHPSTITVPASVKATETKRRNRDRDR
jgi:hypothetical protein